MDALPVLYVPDSDGEPEPLALSLFSVGYTVSEIAARTGQTEAVVAQQLARAGATLTPAHLVRMESAAVDAALPGVKWREVLDREGQAVTVSEYRAPDAKMYTAVMQARSAAYIDAAANAAGAGTVLPAVLQVARNLAAVNAARAALGLTPYEAAGAGPPLGPDGR